MKHEQEKETKQDSTDKIGWVDKKANISKWCRNCLWCGCECLSGSMAKIKEVGKGKFECESYTYFD